MEDNNYLTTSWQGFVQEIIHNASVGYYYYNYYELAENRRQNLPKIDRTIIERFDASKSKDRRYHHKKAGLANYKFLRYGLRFIILKTDGKETDENAQFQDIRTDPLILRVGPHLELKLHKKAIKGVTVHLTKACYRNIKYEMLEMLEHQQTNNVIYKFNALNGIPAYAGVIEHKKKLLKELLKAAKKHNIALKREYFRLNTKLKKVKAFE